MDGILCRDKTNLAKINSGEKIDCIITSIKLPKNIQQKPIYIINDIGIRKAIGMGIFTRFQSTRISDDILLEDAYGWEPRSLTIFKTPRRFTFSQQMGEWLKDVKLIE